MDIMDIHEFFRALPSCLAYHYFPWITHISREVSRVLVRCLEQPLDVNSFLVLFGPKYIVHYTSLILPIELP